MKLYRTLVIMYYFYGGFLVYHGAWWLYNQIYLDKK